MESSREAPVPQRAPVLTRALCFLILLLMAAAALYGATIAFRYFGQIGV